MINNICCNNCNNIYFDTILCKDKYNLFKCRNCGLLFTNPQPKIKELEDYYSKNYFNHWFIYPEVKNKTDLWRINFIKNYLSKNNINILDFGAGIGNFLSIAKKKNPDWNTYGIELSAFAQDYAAKNYNITLTDLQSIKNLNIKFDVITLWHTIEHLTNPDKIILELKSLLVPAGLLFIETPNTNSFLTKIRGLKSLNLIEHLFHYTPETLEYLFLKNDFKVLFNQPGNPGYTRKGIKILIKKALSSSGKLLYKYTEKNFDDTVLMVLQCN